MMRYKSSNVVNNLFSEREFETDLPPYINEDFLVEDRSIIILGLTPEFNQFAENMTGALFKWGCRRGGYSINPQLYSCRVMELAAN